MEIITHNSTTTQQFPVPPLLSPQPHIQVPAPLDDSSFDQSSQVVPNGWKEIRLNHAKNATGRFWCGLVVLSASKFRTARANSRDARVNVKYSVSQTKLVLHYIRLFRHFETTGQLTIELQMKRSLIGVYILQISRDRSC